MVGAGDTITTILETKSNFACLDFSNSCHCFSFSVVHVWHVQQGGVLNFMLTWLFIFGGRGGRICTSDTKL